MRSTKALKQNHRKIHYFNPGHEVAIRAGIHYTPPAPVRKMTADLALLPLWYGKDGDGVFTEETEEAARFLASLPPALRPAVTPVGTGRFIAGMGQAEAAPWGLSPHSIHLFETLQPACPALSVPRREDAYTRLTGRQTAAECLRRIQSLLPQTPLPAPPRFCSNTDEIRQFMASCPPPYILKMPYSCSGRGLHWIRHGDLDEQSLRWMKGAWRKQGIISIEQALDKVCDFAMEFESDGKGHVDFKGWSVFDTRPEGSFSGNLLASQALLRKRLSSYVPEKQLGEVQEAVITVLTETLGAVYRGFLGVDMLIYRRDGSFSIHPMVELNLRYTMGLVAIRLNDRLVHPLAQGRFSITCDTTGGAAYASHLQMEKTHPLRLENKKIRSGYLPLCPVSPTTHYKAYITVN
jgi:hypothetical protein